MITTIPKISFELKKDYDKEKLCNYFCSLVGLKYIDFFNPYIFWNFVKNEQKYYSFEIKLKRGGKYFIKTSYLLRGEYFNELEYGILYMISKTIKKMIDDVNYRKLKHPKSQIDYSVWGNYKKELCNLAFENWISKQGI